MKYKAAVVIQASAGLALVSVSRHLSCFLCSFNHSITFFSFPFCCDFLNVFYLKSGHFFKKIIKNKKEKQIVELRPTPPWQAWRFLPVCRVPGWT